MKRLLTTFTAIVHSAVVAASAATLPIYINTGTVTNPQIDAVAVQNSGRIVTLNNLFETQSTLFYTNTISGVWDGSPGFRFEFITNGNRFPAANFVNRGTISATTQIRINATNIDNSVSAGRLLVSSQGLIKLNGRTVNLSNAGIAAGGGATAPPTPGFIFPPNFYSNPGGVVDLYWGRGTNNSFDAAPPMPLANQFVLPFLQSPAHDVIFAGSTFTNVVTVPPFFAGVPFTAHVLSNQISSNRQFIQVVFVPIDEDTNVLATTVRFIPTNSAMIEFAAPRADALTGDLFTNYVYFLDSTAQFRTSTTFLTNINATAFLRPRAYEITRTTPFQWLSPSAVAGNFPYTNTILDNPSYISNAVGVTYSAYSAQIERQPSFDNPNLSLHPTNQPGRVEIDAGTLNLSNTRITAESFLSIGTTNLVGPLNYTIDAPFVNFSVQSTNPVLALESVGSGTVRRLNGTVSAWSGYWTNTIIENGILTVREFAVTIVARNLNVIQPVTFGEFSIKATNLVMGETFNLPPSAVLNVSSLTVQSNAALTFPSINVDRFPSMQSFTNFGIIQADNFALFGWDRAQPWSNFFNYGIVQAGTIQVSARNFYNFGPMNSLVGPISSRFSDGVVSDGAFQALAANGAIEFFGNSLLITNTILTSGASLVFDLTNSFTDGGIHSSNVWAVAGGIQFLTKPTVGDLLGTTITSTAPRFAAVEHVLAAQDRGAFPTGYVNNVALGRLILNGSNNTSFIFRGVGVSNAIYVDFLGFENFATNYLQVMMIEDNCVVYFADSNLPAEKLDGAFSGRLRWVKDYVGAFSSVEVPLTGGGTIFVNRALRDSSAIDSDADGIPNKFDSFPFDPPYVALTLGSAPSLAGLGGPNVAQISWQAAANTTYRIECKTKVDGQWQFLMNYTHGPKNGTATVTDSINSAGTCFYRVTYFR